jgi:hypothetical protein
MGANRIAGLPGCRPNARLVSPSGWPPSVVGPREYTSRPVLERGGPRLGSDAHHQRTSTLQNVLPSMRRCVLAVGETVHTFLRRQALRRRGIRLVRPKDGVSSPPFVMLPPIGTLIPVSFEQPTSSTSLVATGVWWRQSRAARPILASAVIPERDQVPAAQPAELRVG